MSNLRRIFNNYCKPKPKPTLEQIEDVVLTDDSKRVKKALLMGLNYSGSQSALRGCESDCYNMITFLLAHGYERKNIRLMTEDKKGSDIPTKTNMIKAMQKFAKESNSNTDLFFMVSGHGSYSRDYSGDEEDGRDECLVPLDYKRSGMLYDDQIRKILIDPLKQGCRITCIADTCHSCSMFDISTGYKVDLTNNEKSKFTARTNKRVKNTKAHVVTISGSTDSTTSADAYVVNPYTGRKQYQGAMTNAFLTVMKDLESKKKKVTYKRLMKGITNHLIRNRFAQRPQFSSGYKINLDNEMVV